MLCLRSPVETAASLRRRPYDPPVAAAEWGEQWLEHIGAALAATRGAPRLLVAYDDLLRDGAAEAARLPDSPAFRATRARSPPRSSPACATTPARCSPPPRTRASPPPPAAPTSRCWPPPAPAAPATRRSSRTRSRPCRRACPRPARGRRAEPPLRGALVDALGELQVADRSVEVLREQAEAHRRQATALQARLADAR